ncbi:hypothetical protein DPMN_047032 [Dreissena polymorpha]|uniref:Uncharacterized protein n=1 Tax=Dreissena polymorpha TaxID=45954 RepID=A0A9D4DAQ2_DREPO|nr:hypothetical protein DPMN_047032 [Dreissena polymorpha]
MVRSAPLLIDKPTQTPKQNLSRLNHGAVATHAPQITAPPPARLGAEITPVSVSYGRVMQSRKWTRSAGLTTPMVPKYPCATRGQLLVPVEAISAYVNSRIPA